MHHFVEHNRQLNFLITHPIAANVSIPHEMLDIKKICEWGSYSPTQHLSSKPWLNVWQPMHALILNFVCMHPMAAAVAPTHWVAASTAHPPACPPGACTPTPCPSLNASVGSRPPTRHPPNQNGLPRAAHPLGCCQHRPPTCMPTRGLHPHPMPQLGCECWQLPITGSAPAPH